MSRVGLEGLASPPDLMARARTASALRALYFIKANYPRATFLSAVHCLMDRIWRPPHGDIVGDEGLATGLAEVTAAPGNGGPKLFTEDDVRRIMEGRESMKDVLTAQTTKAHKELGAFGAPWLCVTNDEGQKEVFFGSDR